VALIGTPAAWASTHNAGATIPARSILARLRRGEPVALNSVTVTGRLAFGSLQTVRTPFKCRDCHFPDGLDASDVVFERIVDLSGADVSGLANFEGATFDGPALFTSRSTVFAAGALFRLAVFGDLAAFDDATIKGTANFDLARFRSLSSFANTKFKNDVDFVGASLSGQALFTHTEFDDRADFTRTSIGPSDFRNALFYAEPDFSDATFTGTANFGQTHFCAAVLFESSQFSNGAAFVGAKFGGRGAAIAADFASASASGDLDFTFAEFDPAGAVCPPRPNGHSKRNARHLARAQTAVRFDDFVSRATVALSGASFPGGRTIAMDGIKAKDLRMTVRQTIRVVPDRQAVLRIIEASAKARGDLMRANNADYELHVLESQRFSRGHRLLDLVFYRWVAGYLVRPLRPLLVIVLLAFVVSLTRIGFARASPTRPAPRRRRFLLSGRRLGRGLVRFMHEFLDALSRAGPRRGRNGGTAISTRLEVAAYRVLLGCAIIGLANSNPTLRQLVDALK
jgi:Pentapeptide repeats (9 copies)